MMLFARRVLVMGVWIPPIRAEMIGAHSHTQRHLPQETPEKSLPGPAEGPGPINVLRWRI